MFLKRLTIPGTSDPKGHKTTICGCVIIMFIMSVIHFVFWTLSLTYYWMQTPLAGLSFSFYSF